MKTLKDINWNQVYCFYEVARKLSMKEASQILGISLPTVSEQIKRLEALLDLQLFHRLPKRIELTEDGAALFVCAKEMFEVGGRFLDTVSNDSIGGYAVRVGIQESISASISIDFVNQYWDIFTPFGTVNTVREVLFESLVEKLVQGQFDWGISFERPRSSRLRVAKIASSELVFCVSPRIYKKFKHKEDILRSIPFARSSWDTVINQAVDDVFRTAKIYPDEIIESDHQQFIIELAKRGRCVAVVPRETLTSASWRDEVSSFSLSEPIAITLFAIWPKACERMISIKKLMDLIAMTGRPGQMMDPDLQIKVGDVKHSMLEV